MVPYIYKIFYLIHDLTYFMFPFPKNADREIIPFKNITIKIFSNSEPKNNNNKLETIVN